MIKAFSGSTPLVPALLALGFTALSTAGEPYPTPGTPSSRFEVRLDGVEVPVIAYKDIHYCHFSFAEAARLHPEISPNWRNIH